MADSDEPHRVLGDREESRASGGVKTWMRSLFGTKENSLKQALEDIIQEHAEDGDDMLSAEEKDMLRNVLEVGDLTVSDVMVPRADIVAFEYGSPLETLKRLFIENGHTRMPAYEQTLDRLKGFVHLKDIVPALAGDEPYAIETLIRPIIFISPTMKVMDLLVQMRLSGEHMAIVVDEYGGTDGLVTMEDLFEEIVGEIQDEHDDPGEEEELRELSPRSYEADGRIRIETLEGALQLKLRSQVGDEDYDTLGGLIFDRLGRVPVRGEIVMFEDLLRLDILDADPRRVRRVRLTLVQASSAEEVAPQAALA